MPQASLVRVPFPSSLVGADARVEITTYETLLRPLEVFQAPPLPSIGLLAARLKHAEQRREDKRLRQIAANRAQAAAAAGTTTTADADTEMALDADADMTLEDDADADADAENKEVVGAKRKQPTLSTPAFLSPDDLDEESAPHKRARTDVASTSTPVAEASTSTPGASTSTSTPAPARLNIAKVLPEVRGHTSYLTFACLVPVPADVAAANAAAAAAAAAASASVVEAEIEGKAGTVEAGEATSEAVADASVEAAGEDAAPAS